MKVINHPKDVVQINLDRLNENVYVLKDLGFVIDTGSPNPKLRSKVDEIIDKPNLIILTHTHFDHSGNLDKFEDTQMVMSTESRDIIDGKKDEAMLFEMAGEQLPNFPVQNVITHLFDARFEIIPTPGHQIGSISIYDNENKYLFSGDLIFENFGYGRTDLPSGSFDKLKESIEKLLDYEIEGIFPGHGNPIFQPNYIEQLLEKI